MPNPIIEEPDDRVVVYQPPPPRQSPREPWKNARLYSKKNIIFTNIAKCCI